MQSVAFLLTIASLAFSCKAFIFKPILNERVVATDDVPVHQFSYQADIRHEGSHICSGAVIGLYDVVTVANCIERLNKDSLSVVVGNTDNRGSQDTHEVHSVQIHPFFNSNTLLYDYAIIKVVKPFNFNRNVSKVEIGSPGDDISNPLVCGRAAKTDSENLHLKVAQVTLISNELCANEYKPYGGISDLEFCSGDVTDHSIPKDCIADPGAPLVSDGKLYGLASWGNACTPLADNYVVYTDVTKMELFLGRNKFIYENAKSEICTALNLVVSLIHNMHALPSWVKTALELLAKFLGC